MVDIKAVLFDLDQTLLDRTQTLDSFLKYQWQENTELQAVSCDQFTEKFHELDANGAVWKDSVYAGILNHFNIVSLTADFLLKDYLQNLHHHATLFPSTIDTLQTLRDQGITLGIITNGRTDLQSSMIAGSGLAPLMDTVLISQSEGIAKPDPEIFRRALQRLNIQPKNTIFIGDNPEADIKAAYFAGMKTIWKSNFFFDQPPPEYCDAILVDFNKLPGTITMAMQAAM